MIEHSTPTEGSSDDHSRKTPGDGFKKVGEDVETVLFQEPLPQSAKQNLVATVILLVALSLSGIGIIAYFSMAGKSDEESSLQVEGTPSKGTAQDFFGDPKYQAADEAFREGRREQALELIESLEGKYGHLAEHSFVKATCALLNERKDEARDSLLKALEIDPNHAPALTLYGVILLGDGRWEEVVRVTKKALSLNDRLTDSWYCLGSALRALGRNDEAETALKKLLELKPDHAEGGGELAQILHEKGESEKGLEIIRGVVDAAPRNGLSQYYFSKYLCLIGRFDEGLEHAKTAVALDENKVEFHGQLAEVFRLQEDWGNAIVAANTMVALSGDSTESVTLLAQCYAGAGQLGEANWRLKEVLRRVPEHYEALTLLGENLSRQNRLVQALGYLEKATEIAPDKSSGWEILARIYDELGQRPKAEEAKKKIAQLKDGAKAG